MENEEKGFEIIDKRAPRDEPPSEQQTQEKPEPEKPSEQPTAEGAEDQEQKAGEQEEPTGDVYSLIQWVILILAESAWQAMGLRPNPTTRKIHQDLNQAKTAVDSIAFFVEQVAPHVSEEQKREYRNLVSDLRVNFVQKSRTP